MQLGMIGLGRMGSYMVERLIKAGHDCVVYDRHADAVQPLVRQGRARRDRRGGVRQEAGQTPRHLADDSSRGGRSGDRVAGPAARGRRHR